MLDKEKSAGILGVLRAFLTQYNANLRLFSGITSLWSVAQAGLFCIYKRFSSEKNADAVVASGLEMGLIA